ncbi:unnamed protein product [Tuber aestivum]|uniref:Uncharacterized protein n=1 Tax=Tuber aestivum TaxID=59557 RepID=A0A292Q9U0_9PEZI|nr:unnamed protein product [Tuber aestivum]
MATSYDVRIRDAIAAIGNLDRRLREEYILIGGASLICLGSTRATSDIDLLVPGTSIALIAPSLVQSPDFSYRAGAISIKAGEIEFPVDILVKVVDDLTFEDLEPFTITIQDGIRTLDFPIALGIKIRCFYLRNDETSAGLEKQRSDLYDIRFICGKMEEASRVVDDIVAKAIRVGCYNMALVKHALEESGDLAVFLSVGGTKFQVPWEEDTEDQREYFALLEADDEEIEGPSDAGEEVGGNINPRHWC